MQKIHISGLSSIGACAEKMGFVFLLVLSIIRPCVGASETTKANTGKPSTADATAEIQGPYCGLYSLYGALAAVGKEVDFASLLEPKYIGSKQGSSAEELRQAAEDHSAHAEILTGLSAESLRTAQHPMVLHVAGEGQLKEYNHWVLYLGLENGKARIVDAPDPVRLVSLADLLATWDGTALVVSDQPLNYRSLVAPEHAMLLRYLFLAAGVLILAHFVAKRRIEKKTRYPSFFVSLKTSAVQMVVLLVVAVVTADRRCPILSAQPLALLWFAERGA